MPQPHARCILLAFHKLDVAVVAQKTEIAHKVEVGCTLFQARQVNHLGQVAMPVAPVEGGDGNQVPSARGISLPLIPRKVVERNGAEALALHHNSRRHAGFGTRRDRRLDRSRDAEALRPFCNRHSNPLRLRIAELGELFGHRVEGGAGGR